MRKKISFFNFLICFLLVFSGANFKAATTNASDVVGISYWAHVQNVGWQQEVTNGAEAGTDGKSLRVEALKIKLLNAPEGAHISYSTHVQNVGWQKAVTDGAEAGTDGRSLRVEALKINLEGMPGYSVQYQVHVQNVGWQDWVSDGGEAGTDGRSLRVEALRIRIVKKIQSITLNKTSDTIKAGTTDTLSAAVTPTEASSQKIVWTSSNTEIATVDSSGKATGVEAGTCNITAASEDESVKASCQVTVTPGDLAVSYSTHVQNVGWQNWVSNGAEAGTEGRSLRIEALKIKLLNAPEGAHISYSAHVQNIGWQKDVTDGAEAGTDGKSLRVEALKINLIGMPGYTIQYQAYVQYLGWQNWVSNGQLAGTSGQSLRIEALRIRLVKGVQSVTLDKTSDALNVGESHTLTATVGPEDAADKNVTWKSSNTSVATVDSSGKVTGRLAGTAVITAVTEDGSKTASCTVTVQKVDVSSISLNKTMDTLSPGGSDTLTATISPTNASDLKVIWTSSDESAVKVDSNGKITAVGDGTAVITATTEDGSKTASCGVGVTSSTDSDYNAALNKAKTVLSSIVKPEMSTVDRELAIHDYIVANTDYATDVYNKGVDSVSDDVYTAHGVLVNKLAVCEGYAKAFKMMCDLERIPCRIIKDYDPLDHAWNEVKLDDGNYYQVDCTWDDPVDTVNNQYVAGDSVEHKYFNLSDRQMFGDHAIDKAEWASYNNPIAPIDSTEFYSVANASHDANLVYTIYEGKLSSTDSNGNMKVISDDYAQYINYYNGYVYYVYNNEIYRVSKDGGSKTQVTNGGNVFKMYVYNGAAYYLEYTQNDMTIHKLILDGSYSSNTVIGNTRSSNYFINGSYLYYEGGYDYYLHKVNLTTLQESKILNFTDYNLQIYDNYIFYKNSNSIYRTDLNGQNSALILNGITNFIDAAINHIYYESNKIWYKANLDGSGLSSLSF